jgi:hypothetical protein
MLIHAHSYIFDICSFSFYSSLHPIHPPQFGLPSSTPSQAAASLPHYHQQQHHYHQQQHHYHTTTSSSITTNSGDAAGSGLLHH